MAEPRFIRAGDEYLWIDSLHTAARVYREDGDISVLYWPRGEECDIGVWFDEDGEDEGPTLAFIAALDTLSVPAWDATPRQVKGGRGIPPPPNRDVDLWDEATGKSWPSGEDRHVGKAIPPQPPPPVVPEEGS